MKTISKDTFKKIFLIYFLSKFERGIYSEFRLQKQMFLLERYMKKKPFAFKKYKYGPYSSDLNRVKDLLLSSGWIIAKQARAAVIYLPNVDAETLKRFEYILGLILDDFKEFQRDLRNFIDRFGYAKNTNLKRIAYDTEEIKETRYNEIILKENLKDEIKIPSLLEDEIEDLELGLNSEFVQSLRSRLNTPISHNIPSWETILSNV